MKLLTCPYSECSCYAVFPMSDCAQTHGGVRLHLLPLQENPTKFFNFSFPFVVSAVFPTF